MDIEDVSAEALQLLKIASGNGEMNASWEAYMFFLNLITADDDISQELLQKFGINDISEDEIRYMCIGYLKAAAEQGHAQAQFELAKICHSGAITDYFKMPVSNSNEQFEYWLSKALEQEWPEAYLYLADMYKTGNGKVKDNKTALINYHNAIRSVLIPVKKRAYFDGIRTDIEDIEELDSEVRSMAYAGCGDIFDEEGDYAKAFANYEVSGKHRGAKYVKKLEKRA